EYLCTQFGWQAELAEILTTADLAKADLASHLVYELPNLQGIAGRLLAEDQGRDKKITVGISEHYLPLIADGELPKSHAGIVVSLADKIDTIAASFYNGFIPKGSKDIWGLKRAATGIIRIILEKNVDLDLNLLINAAYEFLPVKPDSEKAVKDKDLLQDFFKQRFKNWFLEQKQDYDLVDAVLNDCPKSPIKAANMILALDDLKIGNLANYKLITETVVRVKRLAAKSSNPVQIGVCRKIGKFDKVLGKTSRATGVYKHINEACEGSFNNVICQNLHFAMGSVDMALFSEQIERDAYQLYSSTKIEIVRLLKENNAQTALEKLVPLAEIMAQYFVDVLVMAEDSAVKNNRLSFLAELNQLFLQFADFEVIVI
ncbi:MAG: glycine--tRNA ligase subunit beta, partial [Candidatus Margulisiibacteriota bacterium]